MLLDFKAVIDKEIGIQEFADKLNVDDLRKATNAYVDKVLALIADCTDADVIFVPEDTEANDTYADSEDVVDLAWTLGHVIVHITATTEEAAALAAEMARGVPNHGRSRSEVPWETVKTVAQCRHRLEESRRMRLASLDMWPDEPYLDNTYQPYPSAGSINAVGRFVFGLYHDWDHLDQISEVVSQAVAARS